METLLFILLSLVGIILIVVLLPYVIAIPLGIIKAVWLIVTGRDNDPEWVEERKSFEAERAAKKAARRERRRAFWLPSSLR